MKLALFAAVSYLQKVTGRTGATICSPWTATLYCSPYTIPLTLTLTPSLTQLVHLINGTRVPNRILTGRDEGRRVGQLKRRCAY